MKKGKVLLCLLLILTFFCQGCADETRLNPENEISQTLEETTGSEDTDHVDIVVGDNMYATQINDWYMNFKDYAGMTVEIEGYFIADYAPYLFVGRYGPSCPYCQGGYVCFEFETDQDVSELHSGQDWIKVTGVLRQGVDESMQTYYYIAAKKIEKMDQVGIDTITN